MANHAKDWTITESDKKYTQIILKDEAIDPLDRQNILNGAIYAILSARETYGQLKKVHDAINRDNLLEQENVLSNKQKISSLVKILGYGNSKSRYILEFIDWWVASDFPERLIRDAQNGRSREFELRDELVASAKGMGPKCASLFMRMCGYENIVPIDIHSMNYLKSQGIELNGDGIRGISDKEHRRLEEIMQNIAKQQGIAPGIFQVYIWVKSSRTWTPYKQLELNL